MTFISSWSWCIPNFDRTSHPINLLHFKKKNNYSIWSKKKGDRSVKRVKSYSKWSENLLLRVKVYSISSKILLFFTERSPFLLHIFYSVNTRNFAFNIGCFVLSFLALIFRLPLSWLYALSNLQPWNPCLTRAYKYMARLIQQTQSLKSFEQFTK